MFNEAQTLPAVLNRDKVSLCIVHFRFERVAEEMDECAPEMTPEDARRLSGWFCVVSTTRLDGAKREHSKVNS